MKAWALRAWHFLLAVILRIRADEPLRNRLRPLITIASTYLVGKGIVSEQVADIITGVVLFALGYGAIEWARKLVLPMNKLAPMITEKGQQAYQDGIHDAIEAVGEDLTDRAQEALKSLSPEIQAVLDRARVAGLIHGSAGEHRAGD